jgi:hypothetical protein
MRTLTAVLIVMLFACAVAVEFPNQFATAQTLFQPSTNINLDASYIINGGGTVRAFVPTGSNSPNCLATLNETSFVLSGTQLFCGQRVSPTLGISGMLITIDYSQTPPSDYATSLTLWQQGAARYGQVMTCTKAGLTC